MKEQGKKFVGRMVFSACLFFAVSIPFKLLFSLLPGVTEIRPVNVIPPLLGLLFGLPAALGIAIGNLVSDLMGGSGWFVCVTGFCTNFLFSYFPYKMWYTIKSKDGKVEPPCLNSLKSVLKYIYIIFVDSFVTTVLLMFIFEAAGFSTAGDSALLLFFNNFDFAMLLGVPALAVLASRGIEMTSPAKKVEKESAFWKGFTVVPYCIIGTGTVYFLWSLFHKNVMHQNLAVWLLVLMLLLSGVYLLKPMENTVEKAKKIRMRISIKGRVTLGFLFIAVVFISFLVIATYVAIARDVALSRLQIWTYIYNVTGIAIHIIFAVTLLFLWYVEKNITNPVELLDNTVSRFAKEDHAGDNNQEELKQQCRSIRTGDEIENLAVSFEQMMDDISSYVQNLAVIMAEKERIGAELNVATQIQASMLPCIFPAFPEREEFDIFATMKPAKEVGGDFYDFFLVDKDHLAMVMADVSGKGVPAALFMVIAKTLLKNHAQTGASPKQILETVNNQLCENNEAEMFVTVWLGIYEISTGHMVAANAGHEYPAICRKNEDFELFHDKHGFVLAGMEGSRYREYELELHPGDTFFIYTDGVAEATDGENQMFGTDLMLKALNREKGISMERMLQNVQSEINGFVKDAPQFDDITMLGFCING